MGQFINTTQLIHIYHLVPHTLLSSAIYENNPNVTTDVELEVKNTQYTKEKRNVISYHLQGIQSDHLKKRQKNQIIVTKAQHSCTTTEYVAVTVDNCQNIHFPRFKGEQTGHTYYMSPTLYFLEGFRIFR